MMEAKPRTITIEGRPSAPGDGDWHLIVARPMFVETTGREPTEDETIGRGRYRLYVADWAAAFRGTRKVKVKLSVQPV